MAQFRFLTATFVFFCGINSGLFKELPSYIHVCKRDPNTLEDCVLKSIEAIKPQLISGIPEIDVPSIDPFYISEIRALTSDNGPIRASGHNVKVTGTSDFKIKSLSVDLDSLTFKVRVRFPKLYFVGDYIVDAQLILPLKGKGKLEAEAIKCDADMVVHMEVYQRDGSDYVRISKIDTDVNIKDYHLHLDGLFNGDKVLGEAANAAINQNRGEFLKATKPHLDRTVSRILLDTANKIVDGLTLDQVLPKP